MLESLKAAFVRWDALRTNRLLRQRARDQGLVTSRVGESGVDATSVLFFTTHKAASSLMHQLFGKIAGQARLDWIDYASGIDRRNALLNLGIPFEPFFEAHAHRLFAPRGEFHGPLRRAFDFPGRAAFRHVFLLRDPRDVLVSAWHSFAFTHVLPPGRAARRTFLARRRVMLAQGMESWSIEKAETWLRPSLETYARFRREAPDAVVLRYDTMRREPARFVRDLGRAMGADLPEAQVAELIRLVRPSHRVTADVAHEVKTESLLTPDGHKAATTEARLPEGHVRSGQTGQWTTEWSAPTTRRIEAILADMLEEWGFER
jgi:hypothetical protein